MSEPCDGIRAQLAIDQGMLTTASNFLDASTATELNDQRSARLADPSGFPTDPSPWSIASVQSRVNALNAIVPSSPAIMAALGAYYQVLADLYNMAMAQIEVNSAITAIAADNAALAANSCG